MFETRMGICSPICLIKRMLELDTLTEKWQLITAKSLRSEGKYFDDVKHSREDGRILMTPGFFKTIECNINRDNRIVIIDEMTSEMSVCD